MQSIAQVSTEHAGRYLQQLCKHWSHRFPATWDDAQGSVQFDGTTCLFEASQGQLVMSLEATDEPTLDRMETVVAEHLKRFAFRENLDVRWSRAD